MPPLPSPDIAEIARLEPCRRRRSFLGAGLALVGPFLAGCGGERRPPVRTSFPPLRYDYLTPIRLNVASIEVREDAAANAADGSSLGAASPIQPAQALRSMAEDRLAASGSSGRAVFVIDEAVLVPERRGLTGTLAVHLDVLTGEGSSAPGGSGTASRAGFAEARVTRRRTAADVEYDPRGAAYDLLRQMMDDMNVEFEFQVRRSLRDWLQSTAPSAPAPPPVEQQELPPPPS